MIWGCAEKADPESYAKMPAAEVRRLALLALVRIEADREERKGRVVREETEERTGRRRTPLEWLLRRDARQWTEAEVRAELERTADTLFGHGAEQSFAFAKMYAYGTEERMGNLIALARAHATVLVCGKDAVYLREEAAP